MMKSLLIVLSLFALIALFWVNTQAALMFGATSLLIATFPTYVKKRKRQNHQVEYPQGVSVLSR